ncbi:MAG: efflux RND transporter permease subunit, partial [Acidobacteriota bacterium]|nr:efflux RND transporter permease subunit [Acidobacteriota bacterium]
EGVTSWLSFVGGGEPRYILNVNPEQANPSYAYMLVNTSSYPVVRTMIERLQAFCDERFLDVVATISPSDLGPPVEKPIQVRISGRDPDLLFHLAERVKGRLREITGTRNIGDDWGRRTKKLVVQVDQPRARRAGVTSLDIAVSLQSLLSGVKTTEFRESDEIIPVILRQEEAGRQDLGKLETLNVYSQATGSSVPLKQVADVKVVWEASKIKRRNRLKTITAESDLVPGLTATEVNAVLIPWLDEQEAGWPRGYRYELGGEIESSIEANESIREQLPVAGLLIVLLLVGQFNSFRKPFIILATIPLALIGVVIGLALLRSYFGFMTLLGIVSLAGIVINNAIVLLDRIQIEIEKNGHPPPRAIIEAAQRRLRPILLTSFTTVGGLLPLYLGGGPMWEPMAITIMFGLLFATLLTLGFVPITYSLLYRVSFKEFRYDA